MTPEEARRTIAVIAWMRYSGREARNIVSTEGSVELRDNIYQDDVIRYNDQRAGRLVFADGLKSSRFYVDFGFESRKLILNCSGSRGDAEDLCNSLNYSFEVISDRVVFADKADGKEYSYELR